MSEGTETLTMEELRRLYQEGLDSGPPEDGEAVFRRLHEKYAQAATEEPDEAEK
jgi:antitoxin ParD1/3/4